MRDFSILDLVKAERRCADPQASVIRNFKRIDLFRFEIGKFRQLKLIAVEARQALLRSHPEKTIRRLGDGLHGVLGEAVFDLPDARTKLSPAGEPRA